jgi:hypothetical protein
MPAFARAEAKAVRDGVICPDGTFSANCPEHFPVVRLRLGQVADKASLQDLLPGHSCDEPLIDDTGCAEKQNQSRRVGNICPCAS